MCILLCLSFYFAKEYNCPGEVANLIYIYHDCIIISIIPCAFFLTILNSGTDSLHKTQIMTRIFVFLEERPIITQHFYKSMLEIQGRDSINDSKNCAVIPIVYSSKSFASFLQVQPVKFRYWSPRLWLQPPPVFLSLSR